MAKQVKQVEIKLSESRRVADGTVFATVEAADCELAAMAMEHGPRGGAQSILDRVDAAGYRQVVDEDGEPWGVATIPTNWS